MFKLVFSVLGLLGVTLASIPADTATINTFLDPPSAIFVLSWAGLFAAAGCKDFSTFFNPMVDVHNKLANFSEGAVLAGWVG